MAVGYSRTATVQVLLDYGADPEVADKDGKNVMDLVEKLRNAMPLSPELLGRRTMLEDVASVLTGNLCIHFNPGLSSPATDRLNAVQEALPVRQFTSLSPLTYQQQGA